MDSVFLDEKNLVYGYSISKDFLDTLSENELDAIVQGLKSNEENIKAGIQMQIENDVNTKILAELCVKTNRGLQYIYHIDDNRDAIVFVTTDELKQHLK